MTEVISVALRCILLVVVVLVFHAVWIGDSWEDR